MIDVWNEALRDVLLPAHVNAGLPVRLTCDEEAVILAGRALGYDRAAALPALLDAAAAHIDRAHGVRALADVPDTDDGTPGYLAGLALLVLAASRMAADERNARHAYYRRLGELVSLPLTDHWPPVAGTNTLKERFADLAAWMAGPQHGRRGLLDLPVPGDVRHAVVDLPISQTMLRAGDRDILGMFFARRGARLDAGFDPVHQLRVDGIRARLSVHAARLLDRDDLHDTFAGALRAAYRSWDGSVLDAEGRRILAGDLRLHIAGTDVVLGLRVPALNTDQIALGPRGHPIRLSASLADQVPLAWLEAARNRSLTIALAADSAVAVLPGPTIIFAPGDLGLLAVRSAPDDQSVWVLTCDATLTVGAADHQRYPAPALPAGWALLCDIDPARLSAEDRAAAGRYVAGVQVDGGLALGEHVYLLDHPPRITSLLDEPAAVSVDGAAYGDLEPGAVLALDMIAHDPGEHRIEVGSADVHLDLAPRGPRAGIGSLAIDCDPRYVHAGPRDRERRPPRGPAVLGARITGTGPRTLRSILLVRYRATVDIIDVDGSVRTVGPPPPAQWLEHIGLPNPVTWQIPEADRAVWVCVNAASGPFVIAHQPVDVPAGDPALDIVDVFYDAPVHDHTDGHGARRWARLRSALDADGEPETAGA